MGIGKITMNELSDSLRTYLENLDTSTVEMNSLVVSSAIDDSDGNDCLNIVTKDNGDIIYICPIGKTINTVTLNWEINKTTDITSASIAIRQKSDSAYTTLVSGNNAIEVISSGNYMISNVSLTENTTIKIIVSYNLNGISKSFTKYLTLYFSNPILYGKIRYVKETDVEGNTINFVNYIENHKPNSFDNINSAYVYWSNLNMTFNINCSEEEEYITFMLPITDVKFSINGLNGGINRAGEWNFTHNRPWQQNDSGTRFFIYKSNQPCLGNCEITVKRINRTSTVSE